MREESGQRGQYTHRPQTNRRRSILIRRAEDSRSGIYNLESTNRCAELRGLKEYKSEPDFFDGRPQLDVARRGRLALGLRLPFGVGVGLIIQYFTPVLKGDSEGPVFLRSIKFRGIKLVVHPTDRYEVTDGRARPICLHLTPEHQTRKLKRRK